MSLEFEKPIGANHVNVVGASKLVGNLVYSNGEWHYSHNEAYKYLITVEMLIQIVNEINKKNLTDAGS